MMKTKRLNRDLWGFGFFPYYQMRADTDDFHGIICIVRIPSGGAQYWNMPKAGQVRVCGEGMCWMTLVPDGEHHIITAKYFPDDAPGPERTDYPASADRHYPVSLWYADVTEGYAYDPDGVIRYTDKYLDIIFSPEGDISVSDRDELEEVYRTGEISKRQYKDALDEGRKIRRMYCRDIRATGEMFSRVRAYAEQRIADGPAPMFLYHGGRKKTDVIRPRQTYAGSQPAVYASESVVEAFPFTLPVTGYPDDPAGSCSFTRENGITRIERGIVDPDAYGYIYRVPSGSFARQDGRRWASVSEVVPLETLTVRVGDHFDTVIWSEEAMAVQNKIYGDKMNGNGGAEN